MISNSMRVIVFGALFALALEGCATRYSAQETYGQVVDRDSGQPLPAVNVVAHWVLNYGQWSDMHYQHADMMLLETVTDGDGRFRFSAWGPTAIPPDLAGRVTMSNLDPQVIVFKAGYEPSALANEITGPPEVPGPLVRSWQSNGRKIQLNRFKGSPKQYALLLEGVLNGVDYGGCEWKKIPRMILALNEEAERLRRTGAINFTAASPSLAEIETNSAKFNCGPVQEFLKEYRK